jgi:hypothetical protein
VTLATIGSISGLSAIVSSFTFVSTNGGFTRGYIICLGFMGTSFILTCVYIVGLKRENIAKDAGKREHLRAIAETEELADFHVFLFRKNAFADCNSLIFDMFFKNLNLKLIYY